MPRIMTNEWEERKRLYCSRCKYRTRLTGVDTNVGCFIGVITKISNVTARDGKDRRGKPPKCKRFVEGEALDREIMHCPLRSI